MLKAEQLSLVSDPFFVSLSTGSRRAMGAAVGGGTDVVAFGFSAPLSEYLSVMDVGRRERAVSERARAVEVVAIKDPLGHCWKDMVVPLRGHGQLVLTHVLSAQIQLAHDAVSTRPTPSTSNASGGGGSR